MGMFAGSREFVLRRHNEVMVLRDDILVDLVNGHVPDSLSEQSDETRVKWSFRLKARQADEVLEIWILLNLPDRLLI